MDSTITTDTGYSSSDHLTSDQTLDWTGTVSDAHGIDRVEIHDGATLLGTATVAGDGTWSFATGTLAAGDHSFIATSYDVAGNSSSTAALTTTIDITAPVVAIDSTITTDTGSSSSDHLTNDQALDLTGTVSDAHGIDRVEIHDGATLLGTATVAGDGTWSFATGTLAAGDHNFIATAYDVAGNSSSTAALTTTIDTTAPLVAIDSTITTDTGSSSSDHLTYDQTLDLTGTVSDAHGIDRVEIHDGATLLGTATVAGDGTWSFATGTLGEGAHNLTATAFDNAGNSSTSALSATIDITAPLVALDSTITTDTGSSASDHLTNDQTLDLTGTVSDAHGIDRVEIHDSATM